MLSTISKLKEELIVEIVSLKLVKLDVIVCISQCLDSVLALSLRG